MKLTKRQKVMMGLCAIGAAVFAYDRVQNRPALGPDAAAASTAAGLAVPSGAPPAAIPATVRVDATPRRGGTMAERMERIAAGNRLNLPDMRDAFRPPASWLPASGNDAPAAQADDPDKARAEAFRQKHSLQAVMVGPDGEGRRAVIDSRCMSVGQKIDEFELVSVGERSAELVCGAIRLRFELPAKD
ncbi:MAG: hypothetical protein ACE15C_10725 [Phycisphaerae bacterium]